MVIIMKSYLKLSTFIILAALFLTSCASFKEFQPLSYDCSVFSGQQTSEYILPYGIGSSFIAYPHAAKSSPTTPNSAVRGQYYALDIVMPIGTPIVASRAGTVVRIDEQHIDGDNQPGHENIIIVEHEDETFARYWHLTHEGALVEVGDTVTQQEKIALSGHTGNSSEPHLHFDIVDETCEPSLDIYNELRNCLTHPITFRNTQPLDCGLEWDKAYLALPI